MKIEKLSRALPVGFVVRKMDIDFICEYTNKDGIMCGCHGDTIEEAMESCLELLIKNKYI